MDIYGASGQSPQATCVAGVHRHSTFLLHDTRGRLLGPDHRDTIRAQQRLASALSGRARWRGEGGGGGAAPVAPEH